ncbi:hypothetical protein [Xanthomonas phage RTH11]|nr:hypothetical protein [Xanthomonas phage RTH11]
MSHNPHDIRARQDVRDIVDHFFSALEVTLRKGQENGKHLQALSRSGVFHPSFLHSRKIAYHPLKAKPVADVAERVESFTLELNQPWSALVRDRTFATTVITQVKGLIDRCVEHIVSLPQVEDGQNGNVWWPVVIKGNYTGNGRNITIEIHSRLLNWRT